MSANKSGYRRDTQKEQSLDDRMRIFEDEIIKRIKVIQSFVKNLDGKVKRIRANQKTAMDSYRKHGQHSSRHGTSMDESHADARPEKLLLDDAGPLGAANQSIVREAVKWEVEISDRKNEERFREIEQLIKRLGIKVDQSQSQFAKETSNEFQNIKLQFEDFGNTIYERINSEVQEKISHELSKSLLVLQDSINADFSTLLNENLKPIDLKLLSLES